MKPSAVATLLAAALSLSLAPAARAGGDTAEDDAFSEVSAWLAPLTLSADGLWRLHVDGRNVLHRVRLADPSQQARAGLPTSVWRLSASRSGQKVAFVTNTGCTGLTDFGAGPAATPKTTWAPAAASAPWSDRPPADCLDGQPGSRHATDEIVALSANGRLLATRGEVVDTETGRRVAALPGIDGAWAHRVVLQLRFVDRDTRLLVLAGTLGAADEAVGSPSDLRAAVWNLATHSLDNLARHEATTLDSPHALFADFSAQTGVLSWVDTRRYGDAARAFVAPDAKLPPYDLVQWRPGQCDAAQVVRFPVAPDRDSALAIDPWGRWVAEVRAIADAKPGADVARLVVTDIDSRRVVADMPLHQAVRGLLATPDGATILALSPAGDVLSFKVDVAALAMPKAAAGAWDAAPCRIDDEAPGARTVTRVTRALVPAWTTEHAISSTFATTPFVMRDGTLWLDLGTTIAQVDLATGKTKRTLPTPRSDKIASLPAPASDGFFNWQGDTLSWRPFDPAAASPRARRAIEVRGGWTVAEVGLEGRNLRVVWQAGEGTKLPTKVLGVGPDEVVESQNLAVALYDAASGKRVREFPQEGDAYGQVGDGSVVDWSPEWLGRCRDVQGALASGIDWRLDAFDSLRATRCRPDGARTTTAWFDLDIAPPGRGARLDNRLGQFLSADAGWAAALDDRQVRAFDLDARREIGQVTLQPGERVTWLRVLGDRRLLLVETEGGDSSTGLPRLSAWALK